MNNQSILDAYADYNRRRQIEHIERIRSEHPLLAQLTDDEIRGIYRTCVSCFQSKAGNWMETWVEDRLKEAGIPFKSQVHIDSTGMIVERMGETIPDIVFGNPIVGTHIGQYMVLSLKTSSRERGNLDEKFRSRYPPKLFLYATLDSDYPQPAKFEENESRKLVCACPKKRDNRKFKLGFEDIISEVSRLLQEGCSVQASP